MTKPPEYIIEQREVAAAYLLFLYSHYASRDYPKRKSSPAVPVLDNLNLPSQRKGQFFLHAC
jgi:hypothetical protein